MPGKLLIEIHLHHYFIMKKLFAFAVTLIVSAWTTTKIYAQSEEHRNKIQLVVNSGGKAITTELNSLSTSISRYNEDETSAIKLASDTSKTKAKLPSSSSPAFYLTLDTKQLDMELLKLFAKKQTRFDGTITITDTYGKNAPKVIKFKQASLYSYSDQFTSASYSDSYGSAVISITCKEIAFNGVNIEQ